MSTAAASPFRYVGQKRAPKENKRFVLGRGRYVADIALPDMKHVAIVASPHAHARIDAIRTEAAAALPGVVHILTGAEFEAGTEPVPPGFDAPKVLRRALASDVARYAGEWVVAVVADTRAIAEDAAELVEVDYTPLPFVIDPEEAAKPGAPLVHVRHGSNVILHRTFTWGPVEDDFRAAAHRLSYRVHWGRSSPVPIETFGALARWDPGVDILDVWASIQMPKYPEQIARALRLPGNAVRVHYDVDVGGAFGVKRGLKHAILVGYLARRLGCPVRFIEDRLENMQGGDAHGPDRIFDVELAFAADGRVRSMRMRALDDVGAQATRAPFQLGKPVSAIVGPYRIHSVAYEPISVMTHKTPQEAVRGFGQAPTNYAIETGLDKVAAFLGLDRAEVRRRNFIRKEEFPYLIPSGSTYDSGDYHTVLARVLDAAGYDRLIARRDALRAAGRLAGIGLSTCLEPSGGNSSFEPLLNPKNDTTTWMDSALVKVDLTGAITVVINNQSSGQGHQTLAATVVAEEFERDPASVRVVAADSLAALPSNSPVGSRMAIMAGGAATGAARVLRERLLMIAAHNLKVSREKLVYAGGDIHVVGDPGRRLSWQDLIDIAHRRFHLMPPDVEPGLQTTFTWEVPTGGTLPTSDGRVQMYPCYAFEAHLVLVGIDPDTAKPEILDYTCGHDCGTQINPDIVHGMTYGGIAQGIGAALYEKFRYDGNGQLVASTFMDYLIPSAHEVPPIRMVDHCTPSPLTSHGQKGSGEAGYLGGPAAIAAAVNDALAPRGAELRALPMQIAGIAAALEGKRG
jgi:2-furoyl-CoA dehydrogenase large subunit